MEAIKKKELIKLIRESVYDTNRTLCKWDDKCTAKRQKLSYHDIAGMVKNWLCRHFRVALPAYTISGIFRRGGLMVTISDDNRSITSIKIVDYPSYTTSIGTIKELNELFADLDYQALKYDAATDPTGSSVVPDRIYASTVQQITFDSIANFKFQ